MSRLVLDGRLSTRFRGARLAKHGRLLGAWTVFVKGLKGAFCLRGRTYCWQICGVDTSFWMKSFRPIFLSLMKAADGERRQKSNTFLVPRDTDAFPHEDQNICARLADLPVLAVPSCSRGDLRVAHRALMLRAYGLCNPGLSFSHQQRGAAASTPATTHRPPVHPQLGPRSHRNEA